MVAPRFSRRQVLGGLAALSLHLAGCTDRTGDRQTPTSMDDAPDGDSSWDVLSVGVTSVGDGFVAPRGIETPTPERQFIFDQAGTVHHLVDGEWTTFLDLSDRIPMVSGHDERGLLGLAFHPQFDSNGRLFLRYSSPSEDELPSGYSHRTVLAEFRVDPGRPGAAPEFVRRLLTVPQPQPNNNGGDIVFGPDGYLYVPLGDGGGAGDAGPGHADDWYDSLEGGNGQDVTSNLLGSILRIDVDEQDATRPYTVPDTNPFVDGDGLDEQYAWGFRDPRGLSFGPDGHLYAADSGENRYEEVNVVEAGGNYGWNVREGTHCFRHDTCPRETADDQRLLPPVIAYEHDESDLGGVSVVGGQIYVGSTLEALEGIYVFADWLAEGNLFAARPTDEGLWEMGAVSIVDDIEPYVFALDSGFDGELYVCTNEHGRVGGTSGTVYRLTPA